jgi:hypothetical protein
MFSNKRTSYRDKVIQISNFMTLLIKFIYNTLLYMVEYGEALFTGRGKAEMGSKIY